MDVETGVAALKVLFDHIFSLYKDAPSLRQECGSTANSILITPGKAAPVDSHFALTLIEAYRHQGLIKSTEGLAAWLEARALFPKLKFPAGVWRHDDPLDPKERSNLVQILRDNSSEKGRENGDVLQSNNGKAQRAPSSAWVVVLKSLWARALVERDTTFFSRFWTEVVNGKSMYLKRLCSTLTISDGYFASKSTVERKAIGLQLVQLAVSTAPPFLVEHLFPQNVMKCIINQRAKNDNNLFAPVGTTLSSLVARTKAEPGTAKYAVKACIGIAGLPNLDRLTKTKTLEEILSYVPASDSKEVMDVISQAVRRPMTSEHLDSDTSRRNCADLFLTIARKQGAARIYSEVDESRTEPFPWKALLSAVAELAYLVPVQKGEEVMSTKVREVFQARATSILASTMDAKLDPNLDHAWQMVEHIHQAVKSGKCQLAPAADNKTLEVPAEIITQIQAIVSQEGEAKGNRKRFLQAFKLLFSLTVLQVHNGDEAAVSILGDLKQCYQTWSTSKESSSSALIEILLSFVSQPSALFRRLAEQVFTAIAPEVGADGLVSLLDILNTPENLNGQKALYMNADEEEAQVESDGDMDDDGSDDSDSDTDQSEIDSDVEVIDVEEDEASESSSDSESEDSQDDSDDDSDDDTDGDEPSVDGNNEELTAFEEQLAEALGVSKGGDGDDSDDDGSDMDDEQMMAGDHVLENVFKQYAKRSNKKKESKDAKATVINFKNRVLDLLSIYVKQCYSSPLVLSLIRPLLELSRSTQDKAVSERAVAVLRLLFDACNKHKEWPDSPTEELFAALEGVHGELRLGGSKVHANAASRSSLFLAKALVGKDRELFSRVADMYNALLKEWHGSEKSRIQPSTFTEWTSWALNTRKF